MINKIFRKLTVRSIRSNFKQFLSVIVIVLLCTMLLSGFITNSSTLDSSVNNYFQDTNLADMWLYVDGVNIEDEAFFESEKLKYTKRLYIETSAKFDQQQTENNAKIFVGDGKISNPYVETGKIEKGYGCLVDKHVADNKNIRVGSDQVSFSIDYFEPNLNITVPLNMTFTITGTMSFDECADTYSSWPIFFDETMFLNELNNAAAKALENTPYAGLVNITELPYNQILLKTDDVAATKTLVENYYNLDSTTSSLAYVFDRNQVESVVLLSGEVSQSKKMIYVFPVIFLIVSVLVILTTINQLVLQEKTKIGTLKSIGVPDRKILNYYSSYGAVLCAIGSVVGIILGVLVIPKVMFIKYKLVYSLPDDYIILKLPFWWLLLVLVGMVLLGYLVSLCVCHSILHKKPVECLRHDININVKLKGKKKKNKLPLSVKMAARNIKVKPVRTLMATIGIAGCVALLLCGFGIGDTINYGIDNDLGKVFKYDIATTYNSSTFIEDLEKGLDGLEYYEKHDRYFAEAVSETSVKNTYIYQIEPHSKITTINLNEGEVCLSKSVADDLKVKAGDSISVSVGGKKLNLTISKLQETSSFNGIYVAGDLDFNEAYLTKGVWIKCSGAGENDVKFVNSINGTDGASSMQHTREYVLQKVSAISLMTTTLKTFAILLAVVVLLNIIFLVVAERTKDIATLKVLGTKNYSITLGIFFEILFMALFGTAVGMILGYPLLVLVLKINRVEVFNFLYHLSPVSFVLSAVIIFATILVVTLLCHIKVRKINMIESLKSVE